MNHTLVLIFSFSIIVPAIIGIVRFNKINQIYFPFLLCIWIGMLNELINVLLINFLHVSNSVNTDIYCLIEALLYTWLFRNLNLFQHTKQYILLMSFLCTAWLIDNFIISKITWFDSYFTIVYSLVIVLMSITIINRLISATNKFIGEFNLPYMFSIDHLFHTLGINGNILVIRT